MDKKVKVMITFVITTVLVSALSYSSVKIWNSKKEEITTIEKVYLDKTMTLSQVAKKNNFPIKVIKSVFNLSSKEQLSKKVGEFSTPLPQLEKKLIQELAIYEENSTKDWFKIPLKFVLWFIFMGTMFYLLRKKKMNPKIRYFSYLVGFVMFGVIFSADPSPMGTVKDAIALWGEKHVIFKPRMIAMSIFLLTVVLVNKMICSWGCQFGALQDFIFRINRNKKDTRGIFKQIKIPFFWSNAFRIAFFTAFTAFAFMSATDIVSDIDPFKIFKPQFMTITGIVFIVVLLVSSLVIYRPWCHLFCPFGLVGWFFEKLSVFKISVDYNKCDACYACEKACPSNAMSAILKQDRVIPDCFACGSCIEVCPDDALALTLKREKAPADHFTKPNSECLEEKE
jgi:polyferredoxin